MWFRRGVLCDRGFTDDKSTLVQVMAWCHQAANHYLSQCGPDLCHHMASRGLNELKKTDGTNVHKLVLPWHTPLLSLCAFIIDEVSLYAPIYCYLPYIHSAHIPDSKLQVVPTWGPPGSLRLLVGPMLAPSTLLSGISLVTCFIY